MKISQDGFDVKTAIDKQLAFTSKYQMFKEYLSGTGTLSLPGTDTDASVTIAHSLGYRPAFFIFVNSSDIMDVISTDLRGVYRIPMRTSRNFYHIYGVSDTSNLSIKVRNSPASGSDKSFAYKYYIMIDKAE